DRYSPSLGPRGGGVKRGYLIQGKGNGGCPHLLYWPGFSGSGFAGPAGGSISGCRDRRWQVAQATLTGSSMSPSSLNFSFSSFVVRIISRAVSCRFLPVSVKSYVDQGLPTCPL